MDTVTNRPKARHWFVAFVKSCKEKKAAEALSSLGFEYYLPIRKEIHKWSDRRKEVERVLIPGIIFIHCMEKERELTLKDSPYLYGYMNDGGPHHPAIVRDSDMETFRAMVDGSGRDVVFSKDRLEPGDFVKVVSGPLSGKMGELVSINGKNCLAVRISMLGAAAIELSADTVEKTSRPE